MNLLYGQFDAREVGCGRILVRRKCKEWTTVKETNLSFTYDEGAITATEENKKDWRDCWYDRYDKD